MLKTVQDKSSLIKEKRSKLSPKEKNFFTVEILNLDLQKESIIISKDLLECKKKNEVKNSTA